MWNLRILGVFQALCESVFGYLRKEKDKLSFSLKFSQHFVKFFDWKRWAWNARGFTVFSTGPRGSEIFLKYLCWTLFLSHGTMPLGIPGCSGGTHSQMNSYMKTLLRSIAAWSKTPIHDCPHSSQVSGGRLQPKYNHERKQISSKVSSWNCCSLLTCLPGVWVFFTLTAETRYGAQHS